MPASQFTIRTELGDFPSAHKAAKAHHVTPGTILTWCETDPVKFQKIPKPPKPSREKKPQWVTKKVTWPLTWAEYRYNSYEIKEEIYQIWCSEQSLDPELEHTANAFFDAMDNTEPEEQDETIE
jgi:hypothetical protein